MVGGVGFCVVHVDVVLLLLLWFRLFVTQRFSTSFVMWVSFSLVVLVVLLDFISVLWYMIVSNNDYIVSAFKFLCHVVLFLFYVCNIRGGLPTFLVFLWFIKSMS